MNRKCVVAALSLLGIITCPAFATTSYTYSHAHTTKHHQITTHHDYKDYKGLLAPEVCTISHDAMIMNQMTQSIGRSTPNPCNPGWFNRVQFSGGLNIDIGKFGNRNANYMGENYQRFSINDLYLNIAAVINDWTKAFASISYNTATINDPLAAAVLGTTFSEYSAAYSNNARNGGTNTLQIEQAYATFSNFDATPFFIQVGKQYQDFSRYEIHPINRTMTQVLSETLATSGRIGFIANGFSGTLTAFDDPIPQRGQSTNPTNYGASLGYDAPGDAFGWDIGAGYLNNIIGVNDVAYMVDQYNYLVGLATGFHRRVAGLAMYGDFNLGPFIFAARYTLSLGRFNIIDLPKNALAASQTGAKPWAVTAQAGYGFEAWGRNNNVYLGYQTSGQAAALNLPKYRWVVGYGLELFGKNTNVAIEWDYDKNYGVTSGGNNHSSNLVTIRAGVKFA